MRAAARSLALSVPFLLLPFEVFAQMGALTGTVRDSSGAVLPGVTVEASSDALIERARTAATDGSGQYRIIDLRPGTYRVTFRLAGFQTQVHEGVGLLGAGSITVHAEMSVGNLQETISVTADSPIIDVQTARHEFVVRGDGRNLIDFMYVDDAVDGFLALVKAKGAKLTVDFGSGAPVSINDIVATMASAIGVEVSVRHEGTVPEYIEFRSTDTTMRDRFGIAPTISFADGLKRLSAFLAGS